MLHFDKKNLTLWICRRLGWNSEWIQHIDSVPASKKVLWSSSPYIPALTSAWAQKLSLLVFLISDMALVFWYTEPWGKIILIHDTDNKKIKHFLITSKMARSIQCGCTNVRH